MAEREAQGLAGSGWDGEPRVGDLGEFRVIERLRAWLEAETPGAGNGALLLGIGDDAALLRADGGRDLAWTCDIQIEGRHFLTQWLTPAEVGARAAEVNLSDLAAMGAAPLAALVSLGLPARMPLPALAGIYRGLQGSLARCGAQIAGGNISGSDRLILDLTVLGRVEQDRALLRSSARPGDVVFVTGRPGRSAAALAAWRANQVELAAALRPAYAAPRARIDVGRYLVENRIAAAVIDQSDGVAGDLRHLCEQSRVGILMRAADLPRDPLLERTVALLGGTVCDWLLGPSDDYELLIAVPRAEVDRVLALPAATGVPVALIGEVFAGAPVVLLESEEGVVREVSGGWDHLGPAGAAGREAEDGDEEARDEG